MLQEPVITLDIAKELGLLPEEFDKIKEILGRTPNFTELSIYSVMWSEHCSYKNSIQWLKTLPKEGPHLLAKAGEENAGLINIGDGLAIAFKIESHNHPSAIEPYQGAATGVGGINRDIFTMGARPIASLNSLRFGNIKEPKTRHLLKGVVKGIGNYGNAFGVPTVAGEVFFEDCYLTNPLVNAMSVGVAKVGKTVSATSYGAGNPVYIVGSTTGKDGIHGATFASEEITEDSAEDLPSVQVGDPFQEKLLLEATLELIDTDAIIGMQDMGAAGIICSTSEMSAKGKSGMNIYLDRVPTRQENMKPFEILLSESQERMLIIVKKGQEEVVEKIFEKWDLHCAIIGEVIDGEMLNYYMHDQLVAQVPAETLVLGGGAPIYTREYEEPAYIQANAAFSIQSVTEPTDLQAVAEKVITHPNVASKKWVIEQYDSMVGLTNSNTQEPSDATLIRIFGTQKQVAVTVDCNAKYIYADPYLGTAMAVSEAARNIVCSGAVPAAITNCLNFGNPYDKHVYWQFVQAIKGMSAACLEFNTPVTGGNVSFYNQSPEGGAVYPTPTIGMIGILEDPQQKMTSYFKNAGDTIFILGENPEDINSSEYLHNILNVKNTPAPYFDLKNEAHLQKGILELIQKKLLQSCHDISQGGLFATLLESGLHKNKGFQVQNKAGIRADAFYFGEAQSRVVVSVSKDQLQDFQDYCTQQHLPYLEIGIVTENTVSIDCASWHTIDHWRELYYNALGNYMKN